MTPKVSVILPSYNHEPYVEAAVRSVMEQTGVDFELIVIDDGSKDRSPEILKRLSEEFGLCLQFVSRNRAIFWMPIQKRLRVLDKLFRCMKATRLGPKWTAATSAAYRR